MIVGREMSLRARLLSVMLGLLALFGLAVGVFTVLSLNGYLTGEVEAELRDLQRFAAGPRPGSSVDRPGPLPDPDEHPVRDGVPVFLSGPGAPPGALGAYRRDDEVTDAGIVIGYDTLLLDRSQRERLAEVPTDDQSHTVAVEGYGDYLVVDNGTVLVGLPLSDVRAISTRLVLLLLGLALIGLLVAAVAGNWLIGHALRPLGRVAATARKVAALPLDRGEVTVVDRVSDTDQRTEVGQVGAALNHLLDNVADALDARQRSEQQVRQFVADASHELRTPLAAIRGYAQLSDRAPEPDLRTALVRVSTQADRMGVLVDDLLLLARLDAGRPLERAQVDLSRLLLEAVDEARVAGPRHRWLLELPPAPVTVTGDETRLRQVITNLLANARTHTPDGTTVTSTLRAEEHRARMLVADDGPGIPPDLLPKVFERFVRGDDARTHTTGSSGLGLAITAAVVTAHHGTVSADSEPGNTVFTVTLPTR